MNTFQSPLSLALIIALIWLSDSGDIAKLFSTPLHLNGTICRLIGGNLV